MSGILDLVSFLSHICDLIITQKKRKSYFLFYTIVMVYFSGFKDDNEGDYNNEFKSQLAAMVEKLGGRVRMDAEFDAKITHVV